MKDGLSSLDRTKCDNLFTPVLGGANGQSIQAKFQRVFTLFRDRCGLCLREFFSKMMEFQGKNITKESIVYSSSIILMFFYDFQK